MDLAKILVRSVVRAFYETQHIVIIDALVNHAALPLADLAMVLDLGTSSQKIAQRLCGKLKEAGLVSVYVRQEIKEGAMKPTNREYYYIDYRRAIDATKYRVHVLDEMVKRESKPTSEKKEYSCPQCHSEYTIMEVLDSRDSFGQFACKRCGEALKAAPRNGEATERQDDTPAKFNKQFGAILELMQQIDNATVPATSGEEALANQLPLPRDKILNPGQKSMAFVPNTAKPTAVKGMASGPEKLELNLTDDATINATEAANAEASRQKKAQQNSLPEWHTHSTVSGERTKSDTNTAEALASAGGLVKAEEEEKKASHGDATLDEYFASLKAEQEQDALEGPGSDDEEEDDFEDVVAPVTVPAAPAAKRVKIEENGNASTQSLPSSTSTPLPVIADIRGGGDSGSDDEDEFEDAM